MMRSHAVETTGRQNTLGTATKCIGYLFVTVVYLSINVWITAELFARKLADQTDLPRQNSLPTASGNGHGMTPDQCEMPEDRAAMDESWLRFAEKKNWLPKGGLQDGVFAPEWYPTLDCPEALKTLAWVDQAAGIVSCPPNATMWTFSETTTRPVLSTEFSQQLTCDDSGRYTIPPGWGLLCGNSIRLRPKRHAGAIARAQKLLEQRREQGDTKGQPPHILMYMMDAVSRPSFYRSLKATSRSFEDVAKRAKELGTNVFEFGRYHSVGGSSIRNLTPMLSGLLLADMEKKNKQHQAWIFEEMRRAGYISINTYNVCEPPKSNSTFIASSYGKNMVDHYFPFQLFDVGWFGGLFCEVGKNEPSINVERACVRTLDDSKCYPSTEKSMGRTACLGGRSKSSLMLEHYFHTRANHAGVPSFAHLHDYDLHTHNLIIPHMYDNDKAEIMPKLAEAGVFRDTVVIYLSDHGNQEEICTTTQGALEYKMPFLWIFVPDSLLNANPGWRDALEFNQQVIASPLDVHETMVELSGGRELGDVDWWKEHGHDSNLKGSSLLTRLPYNRSCADAGIPETECVCGGATTEDIEKDSATWNAVREKFIPKIVEYMNSELEKDSLTPSVCRRLEADSLISATSKQIMPKLTAYHVRFSVDSPRTEPMEMFAVFSVGPRERVSVETVIQTSRFAHWVQHCKAEVRAASGNQHYCDCSRVPDGGWNSVKPGVS